MVNLFFKWSFCSAKFTNLDTATFGLNFCNIYEMSRSLRISTSLHGYSVTYSFHHVSFHAFLKEKFTKFHSFQTQLSRYFHFGNNFRLFLSKHFCIYGAYTNYLTIIKWWVCWLAFQNHVFRSLSLVFLFDFIFYQGTIFCSV